MYLRIPFYGENGQTSSREHSPVGVTIGAYICQRRRRDLRKCTTTKDYDGTSIPGIDAIYGREGARAAGTGRPIDTH